MHMHKIARTAPTVGSPQSPCMDSDRGDITDGSLSLAIWWNLEVSNYF